MGIKRTLIDTIKKTGVGAAAAWLARPCKHYGDIRRNLEQQLAHEPTKGQILWCFWDHFVFCLRYRGDLETDYFGAQLYRKSGFVRRESMAHAVRFSWRNSVQEKKYWNIFRDKREFYKAFSDHMGRKWLAVDESVDWERFRDFVAECSDRVFVKDPLGMGGTGVSLEAPESEKNCRELFELCREKRLVAEEVLKQCEDLASFSCGAVNTLRVITIIDRLGKAHVARCELRLARNGADVDNYCGGGLVAQVDTESGVIFTTGRDKNGREFIFHPDSGKQIVGYEIPDWQGYRKFACTLAERYPGMRYVGWDIIKDQAGSFCVIEGNKDAGVGGLESGLLYGLKPHFDALLEGDAGASPAAKDM